MASEILIENWVATPTNNGDTYTLQNDVGNTNYAFERLVGASDRCSGGPTGNTGNSNPNEAYCAVQMTDTAELTFYKGTSNQDLVIGEVWRYTGSPGGVNEFIVRGRFAISASGTSTSQAVSGIVNEDKCVPFYTGNSNSKTSTSNYDEVTFAVHMDGSGNVVVTSNNSSAAATVYVVVVEFTGTNWSVGHGVSNNHDTAVEVVTLNTDSDGTSGTTFDVGDWTTAFIEATMGGDSSETGLSDCLALVYPHADTDKVYFDVQAGDSAARNDATGWIHVIKHPGWIMIRDSGAITEGNGTYGTSIPGPGVDPTTPDHELALEWYVDTSGTGTAHARGRLNAYVTTSVNLGINYDQGDPFNSSDYTSTEIGVWTFTEVTFSAAPEGVLVEAGGTGTGMGVFFNDDGNFIARGGSGASVDPSDCARLLISSSDYNFANRKGSMIVTIDPNINKLDFEWDENDTGTPDISSSVTATSSFSNWSGGNDGAVGTWGGSSIAGSEVTTYLFDGTIGNMNFNQGYVSNCSIEHWVHRSGNNVTGSWGVLDFSNVTASAAAGTNFQLNIGGSWKTVDALKINIGDSWKDVDGAQINIGDSWKTIF